MQQRYWQAIIGRISTLCIKSFQESVRSGLRAWPLSSFLAIAQEFESLQHTNHSLRMCAELYEANLMSDKPAYLTREGRAKLEAELEELTTNGRRQVAERIGAAKELGDISESGEYEDAKNQQAHLEGRIREVKSILSRAEIIDDESAQGNEVRVGSKVTVRMDGENDDETWSIVGSAEAKPREGKISNESPLGSALLGKRRNQKVTVNTPSGTMKLTILKIQ